MGQRLNFVENNIRFMLEHAYQGLDHTITKLHTLQTHSEELHELNDHGCQRLGKATTIIKKKGRGDSGALGNVLRKYVGGSIVERRALRSIVMEWIEVMDQDQSGDIQWKEFYIFFANFDNVTLNDAEI